MPVSFVARALREVSAWAQRGVGFSLGMHPLFEHGGAIHWEVLGSVFQMPGRGPGGKFRPAKFYESMTPWAEMTGLQKAGAVATVGVPIGISAVTLTQAYREEGWPGFYQMALTDIAVNAALFKYGFDEKSILRGGAVKYVQRSSTLGLLGRGVTGYVGASIGGILGGATGIPGATTVGTVLGGTLGVAPIRASWGMLRAHPILAAGVAATTVGVLGTSMVAKGTYQVLKAGYRYRQQQKQIQTSGSLGAFMTEGAFTMRQRAVQAIAKSHLNARSALGMEASYLHYPSKNYHSRYRRLL